MGKYSVYFGRNPLKEALSLRILPRRIYIKGPADEKFVRDLLQDYRLNSLSIQKGLPSSILNEPHQGVAFEVAHEFYIEPSSEWRLEDFPRILLCNHLQDVQNLGALSRSAAAFGFELLVHEKRRSFQMNPAALKVSMGQAFRLKFLEVSNLVPFCQSLRKANFEIVGLSAEDAGNIYEWKPSGPIALIVGSEGEGISRPLRKVMDFGLRIPMFEGVESLNASQAAGIAMAWTFQNHSDALAKA